MSNSVDPDETAHELSHLDLCCLQKHSIIARGSERVKGDHGVYTLYRLVKRKKIRVNTCMMK